MEGIRGNQADPSSSGGGLQAARVNSLTQQQQDRERITQDLFKFEQLILSTCEFSLENVLVMPYVDRFASVLYRDLYHR